MSIHDELRPILDAIAIVSPAAFFFRGESIAVQPGPVQPLPGVPAHPLPQMPLVRELQSVLYTRCYAQRFEDPQPQPAFTSDPAYVQRLSAANHTRPRWEAGWVVYGVGANGQVSVQKGDRQRTVQAGEYLTTGPPGMPPQAGSVVTISAPRESAISQPGFYFLFGETLSDVWDEHHLLRFYFHATAEGAPMVIDALSAELNRYQIPYRMKALIEPALYLRTDAIVLYLARRYHQIAVRTILSLRPATPLFTLRLMPGIGLAEEPNTGESFGMHRCRLCAEGIVEAWQRGDQSVPGRIAAIASQFSRGGFQIERPHLSPSSSDFEEPVLHVEFAHA